MTIVSISGGKDSIAMGLKLLEAGENVDRFVFADTGMEYPECYDALDLFEKTTGRKIDRVKSKDSFEYLLAEKPLLPRRDGKKRPFDSGYRFPSMLNRWCTSNLKRQPLAKYYKQFSGNEIVECVGIAYDEQKRIKNDKRKRYPLVEYKMTEIECLNYCRDRGFFKSPCAYDRIKRMSCFCCPLQNLQQIEYLIRYRPELWGKIKKLEKLVGDNWKRGTTYYEKRFSQEIMEI